MICLAAELWAIEDDLLRNADAFCPADTTASALPRDRVTISRDPVACFKRSKIQTITDEYVQRLIVRARCGGERQICRVWSHPCEQLPVMAVRRLTRWAGIASAMVCAVGLGCWWLLAARRRSTPSKEVALARASKQQ